MIVFENGRPLKSAYRKFKIKTVVGQDDYSSMREVIRRRFEEYRAADKPEGFGRLPDLILLDGGKGHVGAIRPLLREMGIDVPVYGNHRQQRKKATISTTLTSIPGIGETRAKALMKHFTTIRAVSEATEEMLEETPGMNAPAARAVYRYFHSEENDGE